MCRGKTTVDEGWKRLYRKEKDAEKETILPQVTVGEQRDVVKVASKKKSTKPPQQYTEATLLTAMEHPTGQVKDKALNKILQETSGLGTPATRADIIEKLFSAFYVERHGKELHPTSKGIQLIGLVPPDLRSAELTARWEDRLARIAKGQERDKAFVDEMRDYAAKLVRDVKASTATYTHDNQTRKPCPQCGKLLLMVKGKRGDMLVCPDRECGFRKSVTQTTNARCPNCHKKLELWGEGEKQTFACACGYREKLSDFKARRETNSAGKADVRRFMAQQETKKDEGNPALRDALAKWLEAQNKGDG